MACQYAYNLVYQSHPRVKILASIDATILLCDQQLPVTATAPGCTCDGDPEAQSRKRDEDGAAERRISVKTVTADWGHNGAARLRM